MPSRKSQLLERAAECERLMNMSSDPIKRQTFKQLRDMWIALAGECSNMSNHEISEEIAVIDDIQKALDGRQNKHYRAEG